MWLCMTEPVINNEISMQHLLIERRTSFNLATLRAASTACKGRDPATQIKSKGATGKIMLSARELPSMRRMLRSPRARRTWVLANKISMYGGVTGGGFMESLKDAYACFTPQ